MKWHVMIVLWEKYFASENQKHKLYVILRENYNREEERKKEKWYERVYGFIRKIFNNL